MALTLFNDPFFTEMDRALNRAFPPMFAGIPSAATALTLPNTHPVDVVEHPDRFAIMADAPGMGPEDIKIEVHDGKLRLSGEKKVSSDKKTEKDGVRMHVQERSWNKFSRSFQLPENARVDGISARMEHGVLTVDIPKQEVQKTEPVRIPVQAVSSGAQVPTTGANGKA